MKPFEYSEPVTITEATQLLSDPAEQARILAGGADLLPRLRAGGATADRLVSIQRIPKLDHLEYDEERGLSFGALTTLYSLETSEVVRNRYRSLFEAIRQITSVQVKCAATAVGNLCVATPASDVATVLCSLDAEIDVAGPSGGRSEPINSFYVDVHRTSLERGEMVTGVVVPVLTPETRVAFMNLVRTHSDIAKVTVAVALDIEDGVCRDARIAVGAVAPTVIRAPQAEAGLKGTELTPQRLEAAARACSAETRTISDVRSTAAYRKEMTEVLVRRALGKAVGRSGNGSGEEAER